jgi:alpha-1,3-rhamnosyl/mannosyltransferase
MRVKQAYQLPEKFILTVGTLEPRKNTLGLMNAYGLLPSNVRKQYPLVVVGAPGWYQLTDEKKIQALVSKGEIRLMGFVAQCDLPLLYQAATLFSYVSFYEGYGIPIAEAMACGVPVVTSDRASMPEVANGCAKLVNPEDPDDIAQALQSYLEDENYRKRQGEQGRIKSLTYTWERSAEKLVELFLQIRN